MLRQFFLYKMALKGLRELGLSGPLKHLLYANNLQCIIAKIILTHRVFKKYSKISCSSSIVTVQEGSESQIIKKGLV